MRTRKYVDDTYAQMVKKQSEPQFNKPKVRFNYSLHKYTVNEDYCTFNKTRI